MRGIIVIDGHDGSGKTTLANEILKQNGSGKYIHCTYRWKNNIHLYHLAALRRAIKLAENDLVIIDRLWLSEAIYGFVYRGGTKWPFEGRILDKLLLKHAVLTIICADEPDVAAKRFGDLQKTRTEFFKENKMAEVAELYLGAYTGDIKQTKSYLDDISYFGGFKNRLDYIHYSMSRDGDQMSAIAAQALVLLDHLRSKQQPELLCEHTHNICGYVPLAKYLFLGDKVNYSSYRKVWPFTGESGSSEYIASALSDLKIKETDILWSNSRTETDDLNPELPLLRYIVQTNKHLKIIAMGKQAVKCLDAMDIEGYSTVVHPSWSKRFSNMFAFTQQLAEALK